MNTTYLPDPSLIVQGSMFNVQGGNAKTHRTKKIDEAFRAVTDPVAAVFVVHDPSNLLNDLNGERSG